ncbi:GntR family transcriptional regulator [Rhizobium leguminosarum]|uniref:GntR family transcriptional regulator n=1 Tax=Rhizobium leguminosarum TaxID=384 RepID=UPI001C90981C|nr:GntR family transcriptional regulator [Rhizobium leguminosarum]MBY2973006.1 GntR family transcriptional regulator [Rhizobium leguminosarum]MBY2980406.1 GntR family transcriptional regulator [Rhizobium leguminosarum]MBY3008957.1 GntR family transcriptional regulator [Rhizobium leguminosarum]
MIRIAPEQKTHRRYEIAEHFLRENIEGGRLPTGFVLLEGPIAEILQISRAPVQRALAKLEADKLVHRFNGRGFLVGSQDMGVAPNRSDIKALGLIIPQHVDEALQSRSSWERIYNTVEHDVAGCVVFGLYRIVEIELADHFKVSRTVVRDVLSRLQERGLVRKNQSSHWIAGPLTAQSIKDHFSLRRMLEPSALIAGAAHISNAKICELFVRMTNLEATAQEGHSDKLEELQRQMIDLCVLATPHERMRELIRNNLLPVTAAERLLRHLGLPDDPTTITEMRLVVELLMRGAVAAAAAMLEAHLDASMKRMIAQLKIVAVLPTPTATADYLTRLGDVTANPVPGRLSGPDTDPHHS